MNRICQNSNLMPSCIALDHFRVSVVWNLSTVLKQDIPLFQLSVHLLGSVAYYAGTTSNYNGLEISTGARSQQDILTKKKIIVNLNRYSAHIFIESRKPQY